MKARLLDLLACPVCAGELRLEATECEPGSGEIVSGRLDCESCARNYEIRRGVPRLLPPDLSPVEEKTAAAFGWEWQEFVELHAQYEAQFLDWVHPLQPAYFRDKVILDAGCGIGRHAYHAARYGAREVIGLDLSAAVETAYANTGRMPNVHIVQGSIYSPPFKRSGATGPFDFIYSIGVLHHLPEPEAGFQSLVRFLRPDGAIFAWVYGHENNEVVHRFINPVRKTITSRLPHSAVAAIAWPLSVVLQALVKGVYRPLRTTSVFRTLPSHDYLYSLAAFGFRQNYSIVLDHLIAPVAFYLRREEFQEWFRAAALDEVVISWRNQNSWRGYGRRAQPQPNSG